VTRAVGSHFDYVNQAWTVDGLYVACGHPAADPCGCYGKLHSGEAASPKLLPTSAARFIVQCSVSGGVTGSRSASLKGADGLVRYFDTRGAATAAVIAAYASLSPIRTCSFHYSVREVTDETV
jgi:hypothetical protein